MIQYSMTSLVIHFVFVYNMLHIDSTYKTIRCGTLTMQHDITAGMKAYPIYSSVLIHMVNILTMWEYIFTFLYYSRIMEEYCVNWILKYNYPTIRNIRVLAQTYNFLRIYRLVPSLALFTQYTVQGLSKGSKHVVVA